MIAIGREVVQVTLNCLRLAESRGEWIAQQGSLQAMSPQVAGHFISTDLQQRRKQIEQRNRRGDTVSFF